MVQRIEVTLWPDETDALGKGKKSKIEEVFGIKLDSVASRKIYSIDADLTEKEAEKLGKELFPDKITETTRTTINDLAFDWLVEVGQNPGVTDNVGKSSKAAVSETLRRELKESEGVYTSVQYLLSGKNLTRKKVEEIAKFCLGTNPSTGANPIINSLTILSYKEVRERGVAVPLPAIRGKQEIQMKEYDLDVSDKELIQLSQGNVWALNLEEMKSVRDHLKKPEVIAERKKVGLTEKPVNAEMESTGQWWSEHCKHKIFNAVVEYQDLGTGLFETIDSLFKTYIVKPSEEISKELGWVLSAFEDDAGVVRFNQRVNLAVKIETHNAPSALDPYGGAITGIVGVNRDPLGTGKGSQLLVNLFAYCFGNPFYKGILQEGVLHPRIIRDGVHQGVIDGGNQSGIPLGRGREFFDDRFAPRPLVYCGTIAKMPPEINGEPSYLKRVDPEDLVVMIGGRVGKDGIHGATFSSGALNKESPVQAVQIGDPITQKKMSDFALEARDRGLYKIMKDNGAGGLSSSVGELSIMSNGCEINLENVPLKYHGLQPWEILVSEAQERMSCAVEPEKIDEFLELAKKRGVEATVLGKFTGTDKFHVRYGEKTVAYLDLDFLDHGFVRKRLKAVWKRPFYEEPDFKQPECMTSTLKEMLSRLNICSKENKIRQYDHEVKGLSVIKPLVGARSDVPSDATISFVEYGSKEGLIIAEGMNPHYSDIDTYHMAASAVDEAVRRVIAVGGKLPSKETMFYGLDNFCWNISSEEDEDGQQKLAQLVRANKALKDYCMAFGIPLISGKDSMKNVWKTKEKVDGKEVEKTTSIPPTLLFSVGAKMDDVHKAVTMDVKRKGDLVYVVGTTYDELGGSEYYSYMGERTRGERFIGNDVPKVDAERAKMIYKSMSEATDRELVNSIHTPTIGGLGVALAMSSFAGGYGMDVDLSKVPYEGPKRDDKILFSESNSRFIVTVAPNKKEEFEKVMKGTAYSQIGVVTFESNPVQYLRVKGLDSKYVVFESIDKLKDAWKKPLEAM